MISKYLNPKVPVRDRCEGKDLGWRIGNRLCGGALLGGAIIATSTNTYFGYITGTLLGIEGLGDLLTGHHHYVSSRIGRLITRDKDFPFSKEDS